MSVQELFEGAESLFKLFHSRAEGVFLCQIDTRKFQKLYRAVTSARGEEFLVIFDGRLSFRQDALCDADGARNARRIFIHIERSVEMRDTRPLMCDLFVVHDAFAVIFFVQVQINFAEVLARERRPLFHHLVRHGLKFRKHRLAEQSRADHVEIVVQKELFRRLVV